MSAASERQLEQPGREDRVRIALCGDVMIGRGIDQVLPYPCDDELRDDFARSAMEYVRL